MSTETESLGYFLPYALALPESSGKDESRSQLSSRVYLPAFSIAAVATVLVAIGWASRWGGSNFAASMTGLRVVLVGPVTIAILAAFLVVERLHPAQRRPIFARGYRQDLLYTVLNATIVAPLVVALSLSFALVARRTLPWIVLPRFGFLPRSAVIVLIFVAMDGCNWLAHLMNHRVRMFWRFHELHHSQEDMSVLTVFRTHPLIHVSYLMTLVPGIVLIANGAVIVPVYAEPLGGKAVEALAAAFPDRAVIGLSSRALISGGGSFHCISQQEPV